MCIFGKLGFREISGQYSYKKQPSKIRHYVRKKHLVFLAGATAPFAPPLCTALLYCISKNVSLATLRWINGNGVQTIPK